LPTFTWDTVVTTFFGLLTILLVIAAFAAVIGSIGGLLYWCFKGKSWFSISSLKTKQLIAEQKKDTIRSEVSTYTEGRKFAALRKSDEREDKMQALEAPKKENV
jgi:hypothetical protein